MQALEHLCPRCFAAVPGHPAECPACHAGFKSARIAAQRSLLFPGLGDLYLGHRGTAVFEMLGAAIVWIRLVIAPLAGGTDENGNGVAARPSYWVTALVMVAIIHCIDAAMTHNFALKGHYPGSQK
jgi:hypothetical protein